MREDTERAGCPSSPRPPSPAPAVLCVALNLRHLGHSSSCASQAFGWVRDWAAEEEQLLLLPLETGWESKGLGPGNLQHVAGPCRTCLWRTLSCLLYSPGFS